MPFVLVDKPRPHVSRITLNRPERMNAMSFQTVGPLYEALAQVGADNDTWAVVLTGTGRGFCSGLDLEDHGTPPGCDGLSMSRIAIRAMEYMSNLVPAMRAIPQPIIAAVSGPAYGGGMCLMLGADLRLAGESARFCGAGITNGLTGTELGVSWLLPRLIGAAQAWDILLTGREVGASEAHRLGMVSRVLPDGELLDGALALAEQLCASALTVWR
jgi:enoyl-CoA hydratase